MSDRIRNAAGVIMITTALLLCMISALNSRNVETVHFQSGKRHTDEIKEINTESNGSICVNTDHKDELTWLPGIGDAYADLIVAERLENGPYYYAEDLEAVKGIGPRTLEKFRNMIDLSTGESGE